MNPHRDNNSRPPLAYSAVDDHDQTASYPPSTNHEDPYRWFEPVPPPLDSQQHNRYPQTSSDHQPVPPKAPMIANPRTLCGGLAVIAATAGIGAWLLSWCANGVLARIPATSAWARPPLDTSLVVGASVVGVLAASALLLGLFAIVDPPRLYYGWTATLLALILLVLTYSTAIAADPNWKPSIAPLVVTAVLAVAIISAVGAMGSPRGGTLRTITERHTHQSEYL